MTTIQPEMREQFETTLDDFELEGDFRSTGLLLLTAGIVGTDPNILSVATNLPVPFIQEREMRLRDNLIWIGNETHANWMEDSMEFLLHVMVAEGLAGADHQFLD